MFSSAYQCLIKSTPPWSPLQIEFQSIRLPCRCSFTSLLSCMLFNGFAVSLKVSALSETINDGVPLLAANFLKHRTDVVTDISVIKSKCTARVMQEVTFNHFPCVQLEKQRACKVNTYLREWWSFLYSEIR